MARLNDGRPFDSLEGVGFRENADVTTRRQYLVTGMLAFLGLAQRPATSATQATTQGASMRLTTYILFDGDCRSGMEFYHSVFGGKLALTGVGDSPMRAAFPPAMHDKIVNANLKSDVVDISASDWLRPNEPRVKGNTVCLYLSGGDVTETKNLFQALSKGAVITDPIADQPFGVYGALNDRFGVRWMFHANK
jgi:PhnB protein